MGDIQIIKEPNAQNLFRKIMLVSLLYYAGVLVNRAPVKIPGFWLSKKSTTTGFLCLTASRAFENGFLLNLVKLAR